MTAEEIRAIQAPLKERFRNDPEAAQQVLRATGTLDVPNVECRLARGTGPDVIAGLHPSTGGDGSAACSAEMLLQALVGCAGVTLSAVATALGIDITLGTVEAEGDLDFRGTLGVSRDVPIGFSAIRLAITIETDADEALLDKLASLTERYCVVAQSLKGPLSLILKRA